MQADWNIHSRSSVCMGEGRPFVQDEVIHSALFWKDGEYQRIDLCQKAWQERNDNLKPISYWQHKFQVPPPPPPEALRKDDAESLLRHLMQEDKPETRNARYILALMLERKKILKPVDKQDNDGQRLLIYEHASSGDTWIVIDPRLKLAELEPIQAEVSELLNSGLMVEAMNKAAEDITNAAGEREPGPEQLELKEVDKQEVVPQHADDSAALEPEPEDAGQPASSEATP